MKLDGCYTRSCSRCGRIFRTKARSYHVICKNCNRNTKGFLLNDIL